MKKIILIIVLAYVLMNHSEDLKKVLVQMNPPKVETMDCFGKEHIMTDEERMAREENARVKITFTTSVQW